MNYNFLKDLYKPVVGNLNDDSSLIENFISGRENEFILRHNTEAIVSLLNFFNSSENIYLLNGFMGSGKSYITDYILDFISEDVLVFKNSYQEAINLDDVLLSVFRDFSVYHNEKKLLLPTVDTNIFSEKINSYIKYCDAPMLFIFDSFEINMRSMDTQKDILNFINYLSHFEKIKIIICSRTFQQFDLLSNDSTRCYSLKPLSNDDMYELLEKNEIRGTKYECEELYKVSRGHYLLIDLSIYIMQVLNISLSIFSSEYKKSTKNFIEFLVSKILSISSEKYIKLLLLLSVLRHGVSLEFLSSQRFADIDDIEFLMQKHVVSEKFGKFYLKDYIKNEFIKSINSETKIKIHKYINEVYEAELPLKPFARALFLSRITMRQEIAYHTKKIEQLKAEIAKSGQLGVSENQSLPYLTYSRSSGFESGMENKKVPEKKYVKNIKTSKDKNQRFQLSNEDSKLLYASRSQDDISSQMENIANISYNNESSVINSVEEIVPDSLDEFVEIAQNYENAFDLSSAIIYYKKALTYVDDEMFQVKEPIIYTKLAICFKKLQDADSAVKYYEKVYQLYLKTSVEKANEILLSIAQIYSEAYKFDKAKDVYKKILCSGISSEMRIRVFLDLSELEDNNMNTRGSIESLQKALTIAEKLSDVSLLCECYFKYALLLDDMENSELASKFYIRCVQTSGDPTQNLYLSSAYSNLAAISVDDNNITAAKMYYELSIEADKSVNNFYGLYFSYTKLANLYSKIDDDKTYELLVSALTAAKKIDDITYAVSVYIEIGDYYLSHRNYKQSLKSYILAKTLAPNHSAKEMNAEIDLKMNKLKVILGEVDYIRLINEIKNKK